MALIQFRSVSFRYDLSSEQIFGNLSVAIDTSWKTGVVGRNGSDKTTLLNLMMEKINPTSGKVSIPVKTDYFPYEPKETLKAVLGTIKENIAPFHEWEDNIKRLLQNGSRKSLEEYGEVLRKYQDTYGYEIDGLIEKEIRMMKNNLLHFYLLKAFFVILFYKR